MTDIIKHRGRVEKVEGSHVVVRIVQTSACSACSIKGHCNASESKEKLIDVFEVNASYQIGEEVVLLGTTSMGMQAVLLAFGVPLVILIVALGVTMHLTDGDALVSSLVGLLSIVPYYFAIHFNKDKMKKTFSFTIEKQ
jgi:sigma-E factor negative regulatory protein RseC